MPGKKAAQYGGFPPGTQGGPNPVLGAARCHARHNASAAGPVQVALTHEAGRLRLTVRDHGPGVPEDVIPQLGQAFYRPDSARTRHAGGVGLGLNLCRLVAQAHGGTLRIRNAQPGLEVVVELPG